jgi:hypothetical protein
MSRVGEGNQIGSARKEYKSMHSSLADFQVSLQRASSVLGQGHLKDEA